jgi:hypothetical protein
MKKIARQPTVAIKAPPASGPAASATAPAAVHRPIPRARSSVVVRRVRDERQRTRHERRCANALHHAQRDQGADRGSKCATDRGNAEKRESGEKRSLCADAVTKRSAGKQRARKRDRVRVDDPGDRRGPGMQLAADGDERYIHD